MFQEDIFSKTGQSEESDDSLSETLLCQGEVQLYKLALFKGALEGIDSVEVGQATGLGVLISKGTQPLRDIPDVKGSGFPGLEFSSKSKRDVARINPLLLADLQRAAQILQAKITIGTAISGHRIYASSGNVSRHVDGNAVDLTMIDGFPLHDELDPTPSKKGAAFGDRLVEILKGMGYTSGVESGQAKAVLWRVREHHNHIHVSNRNRTP